MFDSERFLHAQEANYITALTELRDGQKRTHWMWYIFPQLKALGRSQTAKYFGIEDLIAAESYLAHVLLGPRLVEAASALLFHKSLPIDTIMGSIDRMKLRSTATLFAAANGDPVFLKLLEHFYERHPCERTLEVLGLDLDNFGLIRHLDRRASRCSGFDKFPEEVTG
ncbi:DUF1810 domain-containing protein [Yoonia sediminilitoris]|nr:DUF1810 domain-containing protein [Yoonia sediminilitoris]